MKADGQRKLLIKSGLLCTVNTNLPVDQSKYANNFNTDLNSLNL